jgi:serine phosphatase RsbU (regulator of sigma subunit)
MYEVFISTRDSILSEQNQKEVIRQQFKYAYERQAAADSVKRIEEKKIKEALIAKQKAELNMKKNQHYMLFGGLALVVMFALFIFNRYRVTQRQNKIIEHQKDIVQEKNREITDSITYAKRIQNAMLPSDKYVKSVLPESFVFYKPKDIVAGDFYWMHVKDDMILLAVADCTGHGVPGAMVSVICNNGLNRSVREYGLTVPGEILDKTREIVIAEFEKSDEDVKDGMDISLVQFQLLNNEIISVKWSGANNPLWILRQGNLQEFKANKQPIGKYSNPSSFITHEISVEKGDKIYLFTDGFQDQFGGEKGKKFKASNFKELLISLNHENLSVQKESIDLALKKWMSTYEQNDDICLIGVMV